VLRLLEAGASNREGAHRLVILQTRGNLLRMLQETPLDEERAAVDGDVQALNHLLERLSTVPMLAGTLPGQQAWIPLATIGARKKETVIGN
jgi:hypothetical protein